MVAWGDHLQDLEDIASAGGDPKALRDRPVLQDHLRFEWDAFWTLLSDRPAGHSTRIPFTAIDRYADRYGLETLDAFERFRSLMTQMNTAFNEASASRNADIPT